MSDKFIDENDERIPPDLTIEQRERFAIIFNASIYEGLDEEQAIFRARGAILTPEDRLNTFTSAK